VAPVEPPTTRWSFPATATAIAAAAGEGEVVGAGADLEPGTILAAYRAGLFPMPVRRGRVAWWSPDPRGVLPLGHLRVTRSLRAATRRFEIRVDTAFDAVIAACADRRRPGGWIDRDVCSAYRGLHRLGWAHSVEAWDGEGLAGGLYGLAIGGLFAGESMFHHRRDASKVALVGLVELLRQAEGWNRRLLDVQWPTPHLVSLGVVPVSRSLYHERLANALLLPLPPAFVGPTGGPGGDGWGSSGSRGGGTGAGR
jgi:leucyl/phenylalanyl-tRNA--protein transferase